jgi:hypothetical protein
LDASESVSHSVRVVKFYTDTQKQVLDVHEEARRIAVSELGCIR